MILKEQCLISAYSYVYMMIWEGTEKKSKLKKRESDNGNSLKDVDTKEPKPAEIDD